MNPFQGRGAPRPKGRTEVALDGVCGDDAYGGGRARHREPRSPRYHQPRAPKTTEPRFGQPGTQRQLTPLPQVSLLTLITDSNDP